MKSDLEKNIEKVKKSRAYKTDSDNQDYVAQLERDLESLKTDAAFQRLDQVKIMRQKLKSVIASAKMRLIEEDDIQKRLRIKADCDSYIWLLKFFSRNVDREMSEINEKVNELL